MTISDKLKPKKLTPQMARSIWTNPIHFVACGFGIGAIPFAPGTFGTLGGVLLYLMLAPLPLWLYLLVTVVLILIAMLLCDITNRDFATLDHPAAVADEIVGFLVVMIAIPNKWPFIVLGFFLFRLFDVWKPGLIGYIDKYVHGGFGVVLDDVIAALHAWILLYLLKLVIT